ncbi:hypothetical protein SASPL_138630 [Salvia splendens]|uniref:Uncharacterized protein n=1 Tax=Salvia splendens TaxID=180675 RepID=A0A8X8WWS2_SALSN|nr:hypothetical protein SASPL_138630 [Salvia splendens]
MGMFDLEEQFTFYGAYHNNPINIALHMVFVWPILFTALLLLNFTPPLFSQSPIHLFGQSFLVLNYGFLCTVIYALYYVSLDKKAGSLAAFMCFLCWAGSSALAHLLGFSLGWKVFGVVARSVSLVAFQYLDYREAKRLLAVFIVKCEISRLVLSHMTAAAGYRKRITSGTNKNWQVVLVSQLVCWTGQFIGHGVFEKRAPALLDNLAQAFLMAPFFVLLEALQYAFDYEPCPGFNARVQAKVDAEIRAWKESKNKLIS